MMVINKEKYLSKILLEVYDSANWLFNDERWNGSEENFLKLLNENEIILACNDTNVVGFLSYFETSGYAVISGLYVKKENQKAGIASALIENLIDNLSAKIVFAEVMVNALWARSFYEKYKFELVSKQYELPSELKSFVGHNDWSFVYKLDKKC